MESIKCAAVRTLRVTFLYSNVSGPRRCWFGGVYIVLWPRDALFCDDCVGRGTAIMMANTMRDAGDTVRHGNAFRIRSHTFCMF